MQNSLNVFTSHLNELEAAAKKQLTENLNAVDDEFDVSASILFILEQVSRADAFVANALCSQQTQQTTALKKSQDGQLSGSFMKSNGSTKSRVLFQYLNYNSSDFQMVSSLLGSYSTSNSSTTNFNTARTDSDLQTFEYQPASSKQKRQSLQNNSIPNNQSNQSNGDSREKPFFELVKLYKVSFTNRSFENDSSDYVRVFTIVTQKGLSDLISNCGWTGFPMSLIFSTNTGKLV